jgi:hypothetical protein
MPNLFVRVLEVKTVEPCELLHKMFVFGESSSSKKELRSPVVGDRLLKCEGFWTFDLAERADESLTITLQKRNIFSPNKVVGTAIIPLEWFPPNKVVREWFPLVEDSQPQGTDSPNMILLDVHLDSKASKRFKSVYSHLRVIPTWHRPVDELAECPAPPQVIYVIQDGFTPGNANPGMMMSPPGQMGYGGSQPPQWAEGGNWTGSTLGSQPSIVYPAVSIQGAPGFGEGDIPPVFA